MPTPLPDGSAPYIQVPDFLNTPPFYIRQEAESMTYLISGPTLTHSRMPFSRASSVT